MSGICSHLNVIEIGSGSAAAAMAGMVFADAGARVAKVEPPGGDRLRHVNPSGFTVWNRGKESLVADLRTDAGRDALRALAAHADVVIEGFAPGTTERWGVGRATLRRENPALVHCAITGFGSTGRYAAIKAYDALVAAKAGLWFRGSWGHRDGAFQYPVHWASFGSAMQAVAGILGALRVRESTGRGQDVDATLVAGLEPMDYMVATIVQLAAKRGAAPSSDARAALSASRYGVLVLTRDGRVIQTSTMLPHQGQALTRVAGLAHVLDEPRFAKLPMFDTAEDAQAWEDLLLEAFRTQDLAYWLPLLEASPDIAFEVAVTCEQGMDHPQIVHNGDVVTVQDPVLGPVRQVGPIGHFERTPMRIARSAPALGEYRGAFAPRPAPAARGTPPPHPFAGTTVVEFGYFYAMPYATAMLAALGARVIKIEDAAGDPFRYAFGHEVASNKATAAKESISLDLRTERGREIAGRIIARADAFVDGFRPGVTHRLGLAVQQLRAANPRLLYMHAAGYGSDGPYAHRAIYAQAAQAVAGSFGRQVGAWVDPARNQDMSVMELQAVVLPRLNHVTDGDSNAALGVFAALALGLYHQQRTGEGQFLRTSMIGSNAWAYSDDFCSYAGKPPAPPNDDDYQGTGALDRVYPAAEGWVCVAVRGDRDFAAFAALVGAPALATDPRFADASARRANDAALAEAIGVRLQGAPAAHWESAAVAAGLGCVEVNLKGQPMFTAYDPVLRETGLTVAFEHPLFGEMVRAAPPVAFSETPGKVAPPCLRGQHNRAILAELGYDEAEIAALEAAKVVIPPS
ncbi:MAG: CaiB/BaiF CoA transferase family protein [Gammaproteobacteria bacterium]